MSLQPLCLLLLAAAAAADYGRHQGCCTHQTHAVQEVRKLLQKPQLLWLLQSCSCHVTLAAATAAVLNQCLFPHLSISGNVYLYVFLVVKQELKASAASAVLQ
jgi:hypothetical protein